MPQTGWPQSQSAPLVEYAVFTKPTATKTLVNGEFAIASPAAACVFTLPKIASTTATGVLTAEGAQGPICVKNLTGAHAITIKTSDTSKIDNVAGSTGITLSKAYDTIVLVSDGSTWWSVSSNLETNETPV